MSRRTVTCVEWVCDDCGQADGEDYEGAIHYVPDDPRPEGFKTIDGKDVCDSCVEKRECAKSGHQMSDWHEPVLFPNSNKEVRWCVRCGGEQEARDV